MMTRLAFGGNQLLEACKASRATAEFDWHDHSNPGGAVQQTGSTATRHPIASLHDDHDEGTRQVDGLEVCRCLVTLPRVVMY